MSTVALVKIAAPLLLGLIFFICVRLRVRPRINAWIDSLPSSRSAGGTVDDDPERPASR